MSRLFPLRQLRPPVASALLGAVLLLPACGNKPEAVSCVPGNEPTANAVAPVDSVQLYWDNSGSMARFYKHDGPYAAIGRSLESHILPAANLFKFTHSYVADELVEVDNYHDPDFKGNYTDLLSVASQMGGVLDPSQPGVAVLVSDMLVVTPPAQRAAAGAQVCGVTLPQTPFAPFHFSVCLAQAMSVPGASLSLYADVLRVGLGDGAIYALVLSRDPEAGGRVSAEIRKSVLAWNPTELLLLDTTGAGDTTGSAVCTTTAGDPVYMGRRGGAPDACTFRYRDPATKSHGVGCTTPVHLAGRGLIQIGPDSVTGGADPVAISEAGQFAARIPVVKGLAHLRVANRLVAPADDVVASTLGSFVHPATDPATPITEDDAHVVDVLSGIVRVLATHPPPAGSGWSLTYQ